MSTHNPPPLLFTLPTNVETRLLSFVASGTGGIQGLLNLRQTCSNAKKWIDRLPPAFFSRAQVRMESQVDTVQRFMQSPPPFAVTTLSLNAKDLVDKNPPAKEKELWNKFCAFWAPKLETLELYYKFTEEEEADVYNDYYKQVSPRILLLLESQNLRSVRMEEMPSRAVFPASFYKVEELGVNMRYYGPDIKEDMAPRNFWFNLKKRIVTYFVGDIKKELSRRHFYSELKKNPNLRILEITVRPDCYEDFQEFIEFKKEDAHLEMTLQLTGTDPYLWEPNEEEMTNVVHQSYPKFANSIVDSKSTIRLKVSGGSNLEDAHYLLPPNVAAKIFEKVEHIFFWNATEESLPLVNNLPRLKDLSVETACCALQKHRQEEIRFSPTLEKLIFSYGFPACDFVPEGLTSLILWQLNCHASELLNKLDLLKFRCPNLVTLSITWSNIHTPADLCVEVPAVYLNKPSDFAKLQSLTFRADMRKKKDLEIGRTILLHGLRLETLQVNHLALCFHLRDKIPSNLPVLDIPLLTHLCEGPLANSLVMCDIASVSVAPDGLPLLERLVSLASANAREREEREGRGPWQHLHPRQFT